MNEIPKKINRARLVLETLEQGLRFSGTTGSAQHVVVESGPGRTAPDPMELLLVAIAGCQAMDVVSILRKQRQRVTGYEVAIEGERRTEHPKAFTRIEILHRVTGHDVDLAMVEDAATLSHTKYCSVHHSIHPGIDVVQRCEVNPA